MNAKLDKLIAELERRERSGETGGAWVQGMNALLATWLQHSQPRAGLDAEEAVADALLRMVNADAEGWGVGTKKADKAFDSSRMDNGRTFELITGEFPHSRSNNSHYARFDDGSVEGFDGHRVLVRVDFRTFNYLKCSGLSGNEVRRGGQYRIYFNDGLVWAKFCREYGSGLRACARTIDDLLDCSVSIWKDPLAGRLVYYRNHPAVVERWSCDEDESGGNRMYLKPDPAPFPRPCWLDEGEDYEGDLAVTNTLDPNVWWWRKAPTPADAAGDAGMREEAER